MGTPSDLTEFGGRAGEVVGIESTVTNVRWMSVSVLGSCAAIITPSVDMYWLLGTTSAAAAAGGTTPTTTALSGAKCMNWTPGGTSAPLTIIGGVNKQLAYSTKPNAGGKFRIRKVSA